MLASEPVGTFTQFPFRLAWAVTIHKSQGKTFERIVIDLDRGTFAPGQMYVALSRCTAFEGIVLKTPLRKSHIRVDHRVSAFMTGHRYRRSEAELSLAGKMALLRRALEERRELELTYLKANDTQSRRIVIPLAVGTQEYRGKEFPGLKAFCTWAQEERMFRVDRILRMEMLPSRRQAATEACCLADAKVKDAIRDV
jgi:ATP-dependent DNA helicase PIF1